MNSARHALVAVCVFGVLVAALGLYRNEHRLGSFIPAQTDTTGSFTTFEVGQGGEFLGKASTQMGANLLQGEVLGASTTRPRLVESLTKTISGAEKRFNTLQDIFARKEFVYTDVLGIGGEYIGSLTGSGLAVVKGKLTCKEAEGRSMGCVSGTELDNLHDKLDESDIDSSSEILSIVGDETGTGVLVFSENPTLSGLTVNGTSTMNGGVAVTGGCVSVNGVCLGTSTSTGSVGNGLAGQVAYYANDGSLVTATSALHVMQSGDVGIGTTSAGSLGSAAIHVQARPGSYGIAIYGQDWPQSSITFMDPTTLNSGLGTVYGLTTDKSLRLTTSYNYAPIVLQQNGGNVGIGTATPPAKLSIAGGPMWVGPYAGGPLPVSAGKGLKIEYTNGLDAGVILAYDYANATPRPLAIQNTAGARTGIGTHQPNGTLTVKTNLSDTSRAFDIVNGASTTLLSVLANGNVGTGTTSPYSSFHIEGSGPILTISDTAQSPQNGFFQFRDQSRNLTLFQGQIGFTADARLAASSSQITLKGIGVQDTSAGNFTGTNLTAFPVSGNSYINNGGNLGIGTTTPLSRVTIQNASDGTTNPLLVLNSVGNAAIEANVNVSGQGLLGISDNGSRKIQLYSGGNSYIAAGNFGIGTTTPAGKLEIALSSGTDFLTLSRTGTAARFGFGVSNNGTENILGFMDPSTNSTRMVMTTSGNVGIGTTTPSSVLSVESASTNIGSFKNTNPSGAAVFTILNSTNAGIGIVTYGPTYAAGSAFGVGPNGSAIHGNANGPFAIGTFGVSQPLIFGTNSSEKMRIDSSGDVGIGTTSPQAKIHVLGTSEQFRLGYDPQNFVSFTVGSTGNLSASTSGSGQSYIFDSQGGATFGSTGNFAAGLYLKRNNVISGGLTTLNNVFSLFAGSSTANHLTITNTGNVGIGTTTPSATLDVAGQVWTSLAGSGRQAPYDLSGGRIAAGLSLFSYGPICSGNSSGTCGGTSGVVIGSNNASATTNIPNTGVTFFNGGNVGIGTTSPSQLLTVGTNNQFLITSSGAVSATSYNVNSIGAVVPNGMFAPASNAVALSTNGGERLRIDAAGNVGIGTTTPSAQLTTTGTVRFANFGAGSLQTDANGNLSVSSDERLKDIEGEYTRGLEAILGIEPITYRWKSSTGYDTANLYTGFSAQNIKDFIPEAVGEDKHGFLSLSDRPILATIVNALKEMRKLIVTDRIETTEVQTQQLCVGTACVSQEEFLELLESRNINPIVPHPPAPSTETSSSMAATSTVPIENSSSSPQAVLPEPAISDTSSTTPSS